MQGRLTRAVLGAAAMLALGGVLSGCGGGGGAAGSFQMVTELTRDAYQCNGCTVRTDPGGVIATMSASGSVSVDLDAVSSAVGGDQTQFQFLVFEGDELVKKSKFYNAGYLRPLAGSFQIILYDKDSEVIRDPVPETTTTPVRGNSG